ncbi:MAG TPA: DUF2220 family protein [Ruminococcus sp.]|nr:DUF2220 family protein [Ruminococcus sp.]
MELRKKLLSLKKSTITMQELIQLTGLNTDELLFPVVQEAVDSGLLKPFKNVNTNGNRQYPIYEKYHIARNKTDDTMLLSDIRKLHPMMQITDYLKNHPSVFLEHRDTLEALSSWLFWKTAKPIAVSRKERSFEIFGAEKILDDSRVRNLLNRLNISADTLCFYDTPPYCFHDYIPKRSDQMCLLICENKDIWFNLRKMLYEYGRSMLWGTVFDGVIYGEGNRICEDGALTEYTRFLGVNGVRYLYWGDIDREGLNIAVRLFRNNPELKIEPFRAAYLQMLNRAKQFRKVFSDDTRERMEDYASFLNAFEENEQDLLCEAMHQNLHIPQEIISFAVLLDEMR